MKKKLLGVFLASSMMFGLAITAMASESVDELVWDSFDAYLPDYRGDIEVSTVAKADSATEKFHIEFSQYTTGLTHVCAWTESPAGTNYSDPANQVSTSTGGSVSYYTSSPSAGDNVVLNLDNPVSESSNPHVVGEWTPY